MRKHLYPFFVFAIALATVVIAHAASFNLSISISSPPSTAITFTPAAPFSGSGSSITAIGPVASGVTVGTFSVAPTGWQGALVLSGPQAANFSLSGMNLVTAAVLEPGTTDTITITATP